MVAVPAGVSDRIRFEPELPARKRDALARVRYGHAAKLFVPLPSPSRSGAVMNVPERYWCWTATGPERRGDAGGELLRGLAAALERLGVADGPQALARVAGGAFGPTSRSTRGARCSRPGTTTRGPAPRTRSRPPPDLAAALAEPVGPLAFAGEHIGGAFNGLMEGAIRSGRAAAAAVEPGSVSRS